LHGIINEQSGIGIINSMAASAIWH